jgi:oligoendopeptidase F
MNPFLEQAKLRRKFVAKDLQITSWESIRSYYELLEQTDCNSKQDVVSWLYNRSELESVLEEEMAWRYILMNCDTANQSYADSFQVFVSQIQPEIQKSSNNLDKKLLSSQFLNEIEDEFFTAIRDVKNREFLFREENIPIIADLQQQEQEYGVLNSKMTISIDGQEKTLQQAAVYLKNTDRTIRETVYTQITNRRLQDELALQNLLSSLIQKRHTLAINAGYENYRDYKLQELGRFDYTKQDCFDFHNAIQKTVPSIVAAVLQRRKDKLKLSQLKPWDLEVDVDNKPPLVPFTDTQDFITKSIACFTEIKPQYGEFLKTMYDNNYMDLESRIGKAPGGFNYPLYESNMPFIFMNSAGTLRDVETLMHEGGHAIHSFLSAHLPLVEFKSLPSEVAELASMSMELISMEHWHHFFSNTEDLIRAKRAQLEGIISVLSWIAIVDKFQHRLYEKPNHSIEERSAIWMNILSEFETNVVDWSGWEQARISSWQKQLHIFEVPFYYIEYGIAQLGAIAMWKQYKQNPKQTLENYEAFLKCGYTVPIPEIYAKAGIQFSFSSEYVTELLNFVKEELEKL